GSIFFVFVFGLVEVGRGLMVRHQLNNAARQGARVGILSGKGYSDIQTAVTASLTNQGISGEGITVQVNDVTDSSTTFTPKSGDEITVLVSVTTDTVSWVPGARFVTGGTLTGKYTLRRE